MSGELTLDEIRAQQPEVAEMVENDVLSLEDAAILTQTRNHAANYSSRKEWYPKRDKGSGLQRTHDYRPQTDFKAIRRWVLERDERICHYCKADATEVDHLWPRRFGGADHINNLVAACRKCNGSKGAAIDLSAARPDLVEVGIAAIRKRISSEVEELSRWIRAYADSLGRTNHRSPSSALFSVGLSVNEVSYELKQIRDLIAFVSERLDSEGESA